MIGWDTFAAYPIFLTVSAGKVGYAVDASRTERKEGQQNVGEGCRQISIDKMIFDGIIGMKRTTVPILSLEGEDHWAGSFFMRTRTAFTLLWNACIIRPFGISPWRYAAIPKRGTGLC